MWLRSILSALVGDEAAAKGIVSLANTIPITSYKSISYLEKASLRWKPFTQVRLAFDKLSPWSTRTLNEDNFYNKHHFFFISSDVRSIKHPQTLPYQNDVNTDHKHDERYFVRSVALRAVTVYRGVACITIVYDIS